MDRDKFYSAIRGKLNLTTENVFGMNRHLDYIEKHLPQINHAAYALATSWWETAQKMVPVREAWWLSEDWRKRHLKYWPWYGRGLIQVTWKRNVEKLDNLLGLNGALLQNPDKLLDWDVALPALFKGMEVGLYTGKKLGDYVDDIDSPDDQELKEYIAARKVVNGTDKATTIASLALTFEHALRDAGYKVGANVVMKPDSKLPDLEVGAIGEPVRILQRLLNAKGASLYVDGDFGQKTLDALERWQVRHVQNFGRVTRKTWEELSAINVEGDLS